MINEEDAVATFTQPAVVKGQAPGALPQGVDPAKIARSIASKLSIAAIRDWTANSDLLCEDGDKVSITGKIVDVTSYDPKETERLFADAMGKPVPPPTEGELPMVSSISITSVTVNGVQYTGAQSATLRGKSGTLPPESQMDITATFTVPRGFDAIVMADRTPDFRKAAALITPLIQQTIKIV